MCLNQDPQVKIPAFKVQPFKTHWVALSLGQEQGHASVLVLLFLLEPQFGWRASSGHLLHAGRHGRRARHAGRFWGRARVKKTQNRMSSCLAFLLSHNGCSKIFTESN